MHTPATGGGEGVLAAVEDDPNEAFDALGTSAEGVDMERDLPTLCGHGFAEAIHPGRQKMITQIAVLSFFESVFNEDETRRAAAQRQLSQDLAADFNEVTFTH